MIEQKTDDYARDRKNKGALLNQNTDALHQYKLTKKRFEKLNTVDSLADRMTAVESTLNEILGILKSKCQ